MARLVVERDRRAREVDEHSLAGLVAKAHHHVDSLGEAPVVFAELGVAVTVVVELSILFPEQHQRHVFATQFEVNPRPVGHGSGFSGLRHDWKEQRLKSVVVQSFG